MNEAKIKSLMVWVPANLHKSFKKKLAGQGKTIKGVVVSFLEAYCGQNSKKGSENSESASKG